MAVSIQQLAQKSYWRMVGSVVRQFPPVFDRGNRMLYRLNLNYALRGWEKMAWTVVDRRRNQVKKLSSEEFQLLLLCDGETDLSNVDFTNEMKRALEKFETDHLIEKCE